MRRISVIWNSRVWALSISLFLVAEPAWAGLCDSHALKAGQTPRTVSLRPRLVTLSGPSGVGKTTLVEMLIKDFPHLALSISSTTRAPRGKEVNGIDYHFLTRQEFEDRISQGDFAEWAEVHGNYYGTSRSTILQSFQSGKSVLALPDVQGAAKLKVSLPDDTLTVFILPPDMETLEKRLRGRGTDTAASIQLRLANAKAEIDQAGSFDKTVVSDELSKAYDDLKRILRDEGVIP